MINLCCALRGVRVPSEQGQNPASTGYCWQESYAAPYEPRLQLTLLGSQLPPASKIRWGPCRRTQASRTLPGAGRAVPLEDALGPGTSPAQTAAWAWASKMSPSQDLGTGSAGSSPGLPAKLCLHDLLPGLQASATQQSSGVALLSHWLPCHCHCE